MDFELIKFKKNFNLDDVIKRLLLLLLSFFFKKKHDTIWTDMSFQLKMNTWNSQESFQRIFRLSFVIFWVRQGQNFYPHGFVLSASSNIMDA